MLAGQAATRCAGGHPARARPRQHALATPWPPQTRKCAGCCAVCLQWHTAPNRAQKHSTHPHAAARWLTLASTHEEQTVKSRFDHRTCTTGTAQPTTAPHCTTSPVHGEHGRPRALTRSVLPPRRPSRPRSACAEPGRSRERRGQKRGCSAQLSCRRPEGGAHSSLSDMLLNICKGPAKKAMQGPEIFTPGRPRPICVKKG